MKKPDNKSENRVSISAIRRANENLIRQSNDRTLVYRDNVNGSYVNVKAIHSGHVYEISLSQAQIKEAYAKSIQIINRKLINE